MIQKCFNRARVRVRATLSMMDRTPIPIYPTLLSTSSLRAWKSIQRSREITKLRCTKDRCKPLLFRHSACRRMRLLTRSSRLISAPHRETLSRAIILHRLFPRISLSIDRTDLDMSEPQFLETIEHAPPTPTTRLSNGATIR